MSRRLLLVLLMMMLPLQWSWGAAASVCAHETDTQASHFGHHEHKHEFESAPEIPHETTQESAQSSDTGSPSGQAFSVHADCGVCHGLGTAFFAEPGRAPNVWCAGLSFMPYESAVPERTVETLFRPPLARVS